MPHLQKGGSAEMPNLQKRLEEVPRCHIYRIGAVECPDATTTEEGKCRDATSKERGGGSVEMSHPTEEGGGSAEMPHL